MIKPVNKTTSKMKDDFIRILTNDDRIVELLDNPNIETGDELIDKNIFSWLKINFTVSEVGTYIGLKVDYPSITSNKAIKNYNLTFLILSHNKHMPLRVGGNRVDALSQRIIELFNFNNSLGYTLSLSSDIEDPYNTDFYYRKLKFVSETTNSIPNILNNGV